MTVTVGILFMHTAIMAATSFKPNHIKHKIIVTKAGTFNPRINQPSN